MTPTLQGSRSCQITTKRQNTHGASGWRNADRGPQLVARAWQHQIGVSRHQPVALDRVAAGGGADSHLIKQVPLRAIPQENIHQGSHRGRGALHVDAQDPGASRYADDQVVDRAGAIGGGVGRAER